MVSSAMKNTELNNTALKNIVLMRHGEAGWDAATDETRELTVHGHQQVADNLLKLKDSFVPQLILHSPYKRAVQTALIAENIFSNIPMRCLESITPDGNVLDAVDTLDTLPEKNILVITHNPFVTHLMHYLINGSRDISPQRVPAFTTAAIGWIQAESLVAGLCNLQLFITND